MQTSMPDRGRLRQIGDAEADAVVAGIQQRDPDKFKDLLKFVGRWEPGKDTGKLPAEAVEYLFKPYELAWVDRDRVTRAQQSYQTNARAGKIVLGVYSLPVLYIHPEIAPTLMMTGRLVQHVRSRVEETYDFVEKAMEPGTLNAPGAGWQWMRKVRLTHAVLRAVAKQIPGASSSNHVGTVQRAGAWLDQLELAYVLLTFSWVMVDGLSKLGLPMSSAESDDHVYSWAVVGHMIGIVDELLPGSPSVPVGEAKQMFELIRSGLLAPGDPLEETNPAVEDGRVLMGALMVILVDEQRKSTPPPFREWIARYHWLDEALQNLPRILVRQLAGIPTARMLRLGRAPFLHWVVGRIALLLIDLRTWEQASGGPEDERAVEIQTLPRGFF